MEPAIIIKGAEHQPIGIVFDEAAQPIRIDTTDQSTGTRLVSLYYTSNILKMFVCWQHQRYVKIDFITVSCYANVLFIFNILQNYLVTDWLLVLPGGRCQGAVCMVR